MSQKEAKEHTVQIANPSLLHTPFHLFQTFFKHHNILNSDRLWSKLVKMVGLADSCEVNELIMECLERDSQCDLQALNSKLSVLGVLSLLVVTWFRLGKTVNKSNLTEQKNVEVELSLGAAEQISSSMQTQMQVKIQLKTKQKLRKEEASRHLYQLILLLCRENGFVLEHSRVRKEKTEESHNESLVYIKCSQQLVFRSVELPSILEISVSRHAVKSQLLMRMEEPQEQGVPYCLNLYQYVRLIKYFENALDSDNILRLKQFLEVYCRRIAEMLEESNKTFKYYFTLSPKSILVVEGKQNKEITFKFDLPQEQVIIYDTKKIPPEAQRSLYFDYSLLQSKSLEKADAWSVGLSILVLVAQSQSPQFFQQFYEAIQKKGLETVFLKGEIQKITQNRDVSTEYIIQMLKKWLKYNQSEPKPNLGNFNVAPNSQSKTPADNNSLKLEWLSGFLKPAGEKQQVDTQEKNSQKSSEKQSTRTPTETQNLKFVREIKANISVPKTSTSNANKNYTQYSTSNTTTYVQENYSNSNNRKVVNVSKETKLDTFGKKGSFSLIDAKWQKILQKLNFIGNQYNRAYNIFGVKMQPENIKQYKQILFKNKNVYEEIGYFSKGPLMQTNGLCSNCKLQKPLITDHCDHSRCQDCYSSYVTQKFSEHACEFLVCPHPKCDLIVSQQLIESILQQPSQQREIFLSQLMKKQVQNKKDQLVRKCECSQVASYFQISKNARLFLCDQCIKYKCSNCAKQFHGSVECEFQALVKGELKSYLQSKYKQLKKLKQLVHSKSTAKARENQELLLQKLRIKESRMIQELEATLMACAAQVWAAKMKELGILQKKSQYISITEEVITKISQHLTNLYNKISVSQWKGRNQIEKLSEEMMPEVQNMQELHRLGGTILYYALT